MVKSEKTPNPNQQVKIKEGKDGKKEVYLSGNQFAVYEKIQKLEKELIEIENLRATKYKRPIFGVKDAIDQAVADIGLDRHPPYHVLEEGLKTAVADAKKLGMGEMPYIQHLEKLAFS